MFYGVEELLTPCQPIDIGLASSFFLCSKMEEFFIAEALQFLRSSREDAFNDQLGVLEEHVRELGFALQEMPRDGSCQFHAFADQLKRGDRDLDGKLRKQAVLWLRLNGNFLLVVSMQNIANFAGEWRSLGRFPRSFRLGLLCQQHVLIQHRWRSRHSGRSVSVLRGEYLRFHCVE